MKMVFLYKNVVVKLNLIGGHIKGSHTSLNLDKYITLIRSCQMNLLENSVNPNQTASGDQYDLGSTLFLQK